MGAETLPAISKPFSKKNVRTQTVHFEPGTRIIYREIDEERRIIDVKPVTVVEDLPDQIALWLPLDTPTMRPVLKNHAPGEPRRWTAGNWSIEPSVWQWSELLIIVKPVERRATWARWSREREFQGWYVNMQSELFRTPLGFDLRDHQLDILVEPSREWRWKDEAELCLCVEQGRMGPGLAEEVKAEGNRAIAEIERNGSPFSDGWENWKPTPSLPRPVLDSTWDDVTMYD